MTYPKTPSPKPAPLTAEQNEVAQWLLDRGYYRRQRAEPETEPRLRDFGVLLVLIGCFVAALWWR